MKRIHPTVLGTLASISLASMFVACSAGETNTQVRSDQDFGATAFAARSGALVSLPGLDGSRLRSATLIDLKAYVAKAAGGDPAEAMAIATIGDQSAGKTSILFRRTAAGVMTTNVNLFANCASTSDVHLRPVPGTNSAWLSFGCQEARASSDAGSAPHEIVVIRSDDGGRTFDRTTQRKFTANSSHEDNVICNTASDCVLVWGDETDGTHYRVFDGDWDCEEQELGDPKFLAIGQSVQPAAPSQFDFYAADASFPAVVAGATIAIRHRRGTVRGCTLTFDAERRVLEDARICGSFLKGSPFPYPYAAIGFQATVGGAGARWVVAQDLQTEGPSIKLKKLAQNGWFPLATQTLTTDSEHMLVSPTLSFDASNLTYGLFYYRLAKPTPGVVQAAIDVCYRTAGASANTFGSETCVVQGSRYKAFNSTANPQFGLFDNLLVGAVGGGHAVAIVPGDCEEPARASNPVQARCSLTMWSDW